MVIDQPSRSSSPKPGCQPDCVMKSRGPTSLHRPFAGPVSPQSRCFFTRLWKFDHTLAYFVVEASGRGNYGSITKLLPLPPGVGSRCEKLGNFKQTRPGEPTFCC